MYTQNDQNIQATKQELANVNCYKIIWSVLTKSVLLRGNMIHTLPRPLCGSLPLHYLLCNRIHPDSVTLLTMAQAIFEPNFLPLATQTILKFGHSSPTCLWRWNRQSVPKRRHIKFRRRGITKKKTYNMTQTFVKPLDQVNWRLRLVTVFLTCRHIYPLNRYFRMYNATICVLPLWLFSTGHCKQL
jgi:hypothetical protein